MGPVCTKSHHAAVRHSYHDKHGPVELLMKQYLLCRYVEFKVWGPEDDEELIPYVQAILDDTMLFSSSGKSRPIPTKLVAKKVLRNTNSMLYMKYDATRQELRENRKGTVERVDVKTHAKAAELQAFRSKHFGEKDTSRELKADINEAYLWHGTSYNAVMSIFSHDLHVGHKAHVGLFGQGLYFAESCAKADEYAHENLHSQHWYCRPDKKHEDPLPHGAPICAMLLCRVALGEAKVVERSGTYDKVVHTEHHGKIHGENDALIVARNLHRREFLLTSADAVFPEIAVMYQRSTMKAAPTVPTQIALADLEGCPKTYCERNEQNLPRPRGTPSQCSALLRKSACYAE